MNKPKGFLNFKNSLTWNLVNDQYNRELATAMLFFKYAAEADRLGLTYFSEFLKQWAKEELEHAELFSDYLESRDSWFELNDLAVPANKKVAFKDAKEIVQALVEYQKGVSDIMNNIACSSLENKDMPTFYFMEHFVNDQVAEEKKCTELVDAFELADDYLLADFQVKKLLKKYYPEFNLNAKKAH